MKVLDLFSGVGGFSLGLERAGMTTAMFCEIEPFCQKVLAKHWPGVPIHGDIRTLTAELVRANCGDVDLICGGFPCQDVSLAGDRAGIGGERTGLWSEFARIIRELRQMGLRYVLLENVPGLLVPCEFGEPAPISRVLGDLSEMGLDAEWGVISARLFGAPHLRERVFIFAYPREERTKGIFAESVQGFGTFSWCKDVRRVEDLRDRPDLPISLVRRNGDGVSCGLDRVGALGNAIVPDCAQWIGERIMESRRKAAR